MKTEWRVVWFPLNAPDQSLIGTEEFVRRVAERNTHWHPIIESREVGDWEMVENKTLGLSR